MRLPHGYHTGCSLPVGKENPSSFTAAARQPLGSRTHLQDRRKQLHRNRKTFSRLARIAKLPRECLVLAGRGRPSLLLFHQFHCDAVPIGKGKHLIPVYSLKATRSSHSAQYCRYQTYNDALKNSYFSNFFMVA